MAPTRNKRNKSNETFDDTHDMQYEDINYNPSYDHSEYEVTYEDHKRQSEESGCCSAPKLAVFFIFLGLTFGLVFGFVDLDRINSLINDNSDTGSPGTNTTDPDNAGNGDDVIIADDGPAEEPYEFMQCAPNATLGTCCNGLASNCNLTPNEMMWAFVHNANHDDVLLPNHKAPLEQALEAGYRGLMLDVCWCTDPNNLPAKRLEFCHGVCGFGRREVDEVFTNIKTFLDENPSEVIFLNFEISSGNPTPLKIWDAVRRAGLRQNSYIHRGGAFPTMRDLLLTGKQLILAKHNGNDCSDTSTPGCTPRIFEYFNEVIENYYDFQNVDAIEDSNSFCAPFRGIEGSKRFYSINNFVTATLGPSEKAAEVINQKAFLEQLIKDCKSVTGYNANIINVDFWQQGDLPRVVQETNIARAISKRSLMRRTYDKVLNLFDR